MQRPENRAVDDWLAGEDPEPVLQPELPIVDAHHHLWDIRTMPQEPFASFEQKVYLCDEMVADVERSGHNVVQTVFAQCNAFYRADGPDELRSVGETEFAHGVGAMSRSGLYGPVRLCAGIFSEVDLRRGRAAEPALEAHLAASANFRGIRSAFPSDLNDTFLEGFALLERHSLCFDNYAPDHRRLPTLARLADRYPDVPVIVNHLGGRIDPALSDDTSAEWRRCIDAIASSPGAVMKLGGAQQRVGGWEPPFHMHRRDRPLGSEALCELLYPFYEYAMAAFGPDRCMFESNFPVDRESVSYRTLWNTFKRIALRAGLSPTEREAVFSGTARRVYRLPAESPRPLETDPD